MIIMLVLSVGEKEVYLNSETSIIFNKTYLLFCTTIGITVIHSFTNLAFREQDEPSYLLTVT